VVIASYRSRATLGRCLESLASQETDVAWETIVVDSSDDGTADLVREGFPWVRLVTARERLYPGAARNRGIEAATGSVLAFTDADCLPAPGWVDAVASAHRSSTEPVIGGVVDVGNPESRVGWGYYFAEFIDFRPGSPEGPAADLPGCCLTLKRSAWERWGPFAEAGYCSDTVFHWRMREDGLHPWRDGSIRVSHLNPGSLRSNLVHAGMHGGYFARVRCREHRLRRGEAWARAATAPLLPALLLARGLASFLRNRRHAGRYLALLPLTFLSLAAWSWGEMRGYLKHARGA